jgi:hypothetical protein
MRNCRKCGEVIPNKIYIDGKQYNIRSRKFCLKCSSFKSGNTSPNDPVIRKAKVWKLYTTEQKDKVKICNYYRALQIRKELYDSRGGKCKLCGYSKNSRVLTCHHRDPKTKLFGLCLNNLWSKSRKEIDKEFEKCDLLCSNCHIELEDSIARKTSIVDKINKKYGTTF